MPTQWLEVPQQHCRLRRGRRVIILKWWLRNCATLIMLTACLFISSKHIQHDKIQLQFFIASLGNFFPPHFQKPKTQAVSVFLC